MRVLGHDEGLKFIVHTLGVFFNLGERKAGTDRSHGDTVYLTIQGWFVSIKDYVIKLINQEASYAAYQQGFADRMVHRMLLKVDGANLKNRHCIIVRVYFSI